MTSYLPPPLTDEQIIAQAGSMLERGLIPAIEHSTDLRPREHYWSLWKLPLFEAETPEEVMAEVEACARANPHAYVRLTGFDTKRRGQVANLMIRRPA